MVLVFKPNFSRAAKSFDFVSYFCFSSILFSHHVIVLLSEQITVVESNSFKALYQVVVNMSHNRLSWVLSICLTTGYLQFCQYVPKKLVNLNAVVVPTFKYLISFSYPVLSTCQRMCSSSVTTSRWTSPTMVGRTNHPPFTIHQFPGMKVISSTIPHPRYEGHPPWSLRRAQLRLPLQRQSQPSQQHVPGLIGKYYVTIFYFLFFRSRWRTRRESSFLTPPSTICLRFPGFSTRLEPDFHFHLKSPGTLSQSCTSWSRSTTATTTSPRFTDPSSHPSSVSGKGWGP